VAAPSDERKTPPDPGRRRGPGRPRKNEDWVNPRTVPRQALAGTFEVGPRSRLTRRPASQAATRAPLGHSRRWTVVPVRAVGSNVRPPSGERRTPFPVPTKQRGVGRGPAGGNGLPDPRSERQPHPGLAEVLREVEAALATEPDLVGVRVDRADGSDPVESTPDPLPDTGSHDPAQVVERQRPSRGAREEVSGW